MLGDVNQVLHSTAQSPLIDVLQGLAHRLPELGAIVISEFVSREFSHCRVARGVSSLLADFLAECGYSFRPRRVGKELPV